jgi:antirestriction protein ArdC
MHISALYESVTNSIIADLEKGVASWVKPWKNGNTGGILPMNAATKRSYNGINIPILWHAQLSRGYPTAGWMTYTQALELGAQVRGAKKSTHVVFTKQLNVKHTETVEEKKIGVLKAYSGSGQYAMYAQTADSLTPEDSLFIARNV